MLSLIAPLACHPSAESESSPTDTPAPDTEEDTGTPEKPEDLRASLTVVDGVAGEMLGRSMSRIGDQDGDLSLKEATLVFTGAMARGYAGFGLAAADLDGDGLDDQAVSAYWESSRKQRNGVVYVFSGPPQGSATTSTVRACEHTCTWEMTCDRPPR